MKLLEPIEVGEMKLKNKMVMAAMTRSRANTEGIVSDLTVEYYKQRAGAGLILSEAISISEASVGYPFVPGIYNNEQINAWKKVTTAVHEKGGHIFAQLWHLGRMSHSTNRNGKLPLAPSAVAVKNMQSFTLEGLKDYETPVALTLSEIKQTVKDYVQAAKNALKAGFDGVEFHAANGYLPNQFLADSSNTRTDEYGGSIENKSRFVLEVMRELIHEIGGDKVGIKISPLHPYGETIFDDPIASFTYLIEELNKMDFAFIELMKRNAMAPQPSHYPTNDEIDLFGRISKNTIIANTGYTKETAENEIEKRVAKLVSFGSLFLANPDLPQRFELNTDLNEPERETFFGGAEKGYTDYPFIS